MYEGLYAPLPDGQLYAERIGLPWPLTPDLETLDRIFWAHQCTVPFENMQPYDEGQEPSLEIGALFDKIVVRRRGGYCFELNALLCAFLQSIGYDAWSVSCRIVRGKDFIPPMLHRAILVRLDGQMYYGDVGYGGPQPAGAVPVGGERTLNGERFCIEALEAPWWRLDRYTSRGEREHVIEFWTTPMPAVYFVPYNFYSGKSPESMFCQRRVLNLRTAAGNLSLTDTALTERRDGEIFTKEAASREELAALIKTYFGIDFPAHLLRWEKR